MQKIQNFKTLATNDLRAAALQIAEAGLEAIDTEAVMRQSVSYENNDLKILGRSFTVAPDGRLIVVGVGKCALEAARALEGISGDRIAAGAVIDVHEGTLTRIKTYRGTHPFPTEENVAATKAIVALLEGLTERDFVLFIISGGGSTLLCQPKNFTCEDEQALLHHLFETGATIEEINTVRKHLSLARGGYLAQYAYPARSAALIFSDVPGDDFEFIASGPTVRDTTTVDDARAVLKKYDIDGNFSRIADNLIETPKDEKYFANVSNFLAVNNMTALRVMEQEGQKLGFAVKIMTAALQGEAREVGQATARELHAAPARTMLLYGGETTVTIVNPAGVGGRNQEVVLGALAEIKSGELVMSVATDGRDNTGYGGALCDIITKETAEKKNLVPETFLKENRSYDFFEAEGDYLLMGDTGSNVSDLIIAIKE
jgi:glycerate 2-kinase